MRRQTNGIFSGGGGPNGNWIFDYIPGTPAANQSSYSAGATMFAPISNIATTGTAKPKLLSVSATANLTFIMSTALFGKLGKVRMGLVLDVPPPGTWGNPRVMAPFPDDPSLMTDMWNPANDPMPPITPNAVITSQPQTFFISGEILPPVPLDIPTEQDISVGIWITPSLLAPRAALPLNTVIGLLVGNATWSVNYDDGL